MIEKDLKALVASEMDSVHWALSKSDKEAFENRDYRGIRKRSQIGFIWDILLLGIVTSGSIFSSLRMLQDEDQSERLFAGFPLILPVVVGVQFGLSLAKRRRKEEYFSALIAENERSGE